MVDPPVLKSNLAKRIPELLGNVEVDKEWCEFLDDPSKYYTDFDKVRREIEDVTDLKAGSNKGITDDPIHIKIHSNRVVNLTLVDLPGMVKVSGI